MNVAIYPAKDDWAFGQIFRAVKKYSSLPIALFDTMDDLSKLQDFDLIHVPAIVNHVRLLKGNPELIGKTCCSIHGIAELYNYNPLIDKARETSEKEIESGILPEDVIIYINRLRRIACVSDELVDLLKKNTTAKVYKLPCGADSDIFKSKHLPFNERLKIICPISREYIKTIRRVHGYDVKRYDLVLKLEKLVDAEFIFLDKLVSVDEIVDFYKKGNIIINLSHSEGNPLGFIEAGLMGVVPIITSVGVVPEVIIDKENGMVISGNSEEELIYNAMVSIDYLSKNPDKLSKMSHNIQKTIRNSRTWKVLIDQWDKYFASMIDTMVFVEIGSNCFDTLNHLAEDGWSGVMVEPVGEYFTAIQKLKGVSYEQVAVGDKAGTFEIKYLSNSTIDKNNLPAWAKGLGSVGMHPTIIKNGWENLLETNKTEMIMFDELIRRNFIGKINLLKIDTEGMDCEILEQVDLEKVDEIIFEHVLCPNDRVEKSIGSLQRKGFNVRYMGDNICAKKRENALVAVCIPTTDDRKIFLEELILSLTAQTFQDFIIYTVNNVSPIGKAKHDVVEMALKKGNHKIICMIDDDDLVEPTYIEKVVEHLYKNDIDWCFTWGSLFDGRTGFIHGEIQCPAEMLVENHQPAWISAKTDVFKEINYLETDAYAEDMVLWIRLYDAGFNGSIIKEELYLKRWHDKSLTVSHLSAYSSPARLRFHMLGYVHLPCSREYMACAFSMKNYKLAEMLLSLGHEVFYYGAEGSTVPCTEFIQTHSLKDICQTWGDGDNQFDIGYDWTTTQFRHDFNTQKTPLTLRFYDKCVEEINKRKRPDDFLLVMQGFYHKPISDKVGLYLTCEPGIGYRGSVKTNWRAFESSFVQNFSYGSENPFGDINGSHYDRIIPNYFDPQDFEFCDTPEDYYLYIGRMIQRKGIQVAIEATKAVGAKLILVGQRDSEISEKSLPPHCEFLGFADVAKRKRLLSHAIATFTPTFYLESFAGTHIESMISGTPPITTNFAVFAETIPDYLREKVGFRCDTLNDFIDAALKAKAFTKEDRMFVRDYGQRFLMDNVKWEFEKWWRDLYSVYQSTLSPSVLGWARIDKEEPIWRKNLYWGLTKK